MEHDNKQQKSGSEHMQKNDVHGHSKTAAKDGSTVTEGRKNVADNTSGAAKKPVQTRDKRHSSEELRRRIL